jgi:hypothetical protein
MTDIELDLSGVSELQATIEALQERGGSDAVYVTGTDREYGIFLELGTEDMPPYPWFRPAIREFRANPKRFIRDNTDFSGIDEIETADELVATVATALQTQMEKNVSANTSADRSPGTHPDHPQRDTGALVNSIQAVRIK